jgi:hypothetical protein
MRCAFDDGLMILDLGPLAFDDWRCIECQRTLRLPNGTARTDHKLGNEYVYLRRDGPRRRANPVLVEGSDSPPERA